MAAKRRFRKNDRVRFRLGVRDVKGVVTEDRGPIGINGRHLYGVEFRLERGSDAISYTELPADDMHLVKPTASTR
ncbi:MAG TPA: hypothetical protein VFC46_17385 [Humisphaera sp.]|nr:hypothetical protein [Humisphaera sp.]